MSNHSTGTNIQYLGQLLCMSWIDVSVSGPLAGVTGQAINLLLLPYLRSLNIHQSITTPLSGMDSSKTRSPPCMPLFLWLNKNILTMSRWLLQQMSLQSVHVVHGVLSLSSLKDHYYTCPDCSRVFIPVTRYNSRGSWYQHEIDIQHENL